MDQKWTEKQRAHETQDMEYKAMKFAEYSKGPKLVDTADNDLRDHMIAFRKTETEKKSNREVVDTIQKYFDENETMDGEKSLKIVAGQFARYFENVPDNDQIMDSCRDKMIEQYSQICVREFHLKDVANMEGIKDFHASDVIRTEDGKDKYKAESQINRAVHEKDGIMYSRYYASAVVSDENGPKIDVIGEIDKYERGAWAHRGMAGMIGETLVIDNTGGHMKNLTVRLFVDLGQEPEGRSIKLEQNNSNGKNEPDDGLDDDFAKAVNELSADNENSLSC